MIKIKNLRKVFDNGFEALHDVNLDIDEGKLVCLLGPSGCGKSTILNLIAGLLEPTEGDILFDGESVVHKHPKDRNIGMVFQNYALYPHMTVLENITFPLRVGKHKKNKEEAEELAKDYLELTDITDIAEKKPNALSGGQQQRVAITRALVQNPNILLLDEPLSNLDARLRLKIREEIRQLVKKIGVTTIFVTHDQEEALSISDKIALMDEGVIQQYADPQNLYLEPANLFVAKFIGNPVLNVFEVKYEKDKFISEEFTLDKSSFVSDRFKDELNKDRYIIGIRPEHFIIDENGPIEVTIESVEMLGRYSILNFELNGEMARTIMDSRNEHKVGDTIRLDIDFKSIYLFETDGRRVY